MPPKKKKSKRTRKIKPFTFETFENALFEQAVKEIKKNFQRMKRDSGSNFYLGVKLLKLFPKTRNYRQAFYQFQGNLCLSFQNSPDMFKTFLRELISSIDDIEKSIKNVIEKHIDDENERLERTAFLDFLDCHRKENDQ